MKTVEVYFMKKDWFEKGINGEIPDISLESTHIKIGELLLPADGKDLCEKTYDYYTVDIWDEKHAVAAVVRGIHMTKTNEAGVHSAMTVGDCVVIDGVVFLCRASGFEAIGMKK